MEDWQVPIMKAMAAHVTSTHGDVLEVGFGRGVSATYVQQGGVRSHTVVESNDHSVNHHFAPWRRRYPEQDIRLLHGRWQDVLDRFETYDGILFHAFPLNEAEFIEHVLNSITFAGHFFPTAAAHLKPGGIFTYLTTEVDSLSRRHQRLLFQHFREITLHVQPVSVPEDTQDAWWADSMVISKAVK
jgi:guanidinoacetate N-methyltransferase